ncbi:serum response factor-binding protein 1-like isoform X1 [Haliotis cracherodii]|uniref:serum response factor-binding protein 1-like isoform X1 n=2 Tax=Haliotis cracherodii TaxID=6455 RepID=UPI0039EB1CE2
MSTDKPRSLDVAETASIDLMSLNNNIVTMRKRVKQAKVRVIRRLVRSIESLKKKKGTPVMVEKNTRKAERLVEEIHAIKHLKADKISKFAIGNTMSFVELCKQDNASIQSRALTRVSENEVIQKEVTKFRDTHPDWKSLSAFLLMKQSGRRYKKKKNRSTAEKVDTNVKAREAMLEAYLENKLEKKVDIEKIKNSGRVRKEKQKKNLDKKQAENGGDSGNTTPSESDSEEGVDSEGVDSEGVDREGVDREGVDGDAVDRTKVTERSSVKQDRSLCFSGVGKEPLKTWDDSDSGDSEDVEERTTEEKSRKKSPLQEGSGDRKNQGKGGSEKDGNKKKGGLKLEILQQMFSSKDGDSESESDSGQSSGEDEVKKDASKSTQKAKIKSKITKQMLPADSGGDDSDSEEDMTEEELIESDTQTDEIQRENEDKKKTPAPKASKQDKRKEKNKIMVVKKINLEDLENDEDLKVKKYPEDVPGILLTPEVKKTRDAFFAGSEDESDAEDVDEDEASSQDNSSDDEDEEEGPSTFKSTFIGTLAHKNQLKRGGWSDRNRGRGRGSGVRGQSDGNRGHKFRGRGDFRGGRGDFQGGRGDYRGGYGGKNRSDFPRDKFQRFDGRGRGSEFRGRGSSFRGRGSNQGKDRHNLDNQSSRDRGGNSYTSAAPRTSLGKQEDKSAARKSGGHASSSSTSSLHPSWEASKRKKEQSGIQTFKGKKIKFDD